MIILHLSTMILKADRINAKQQKIVFRLEQRSTRASRRSRVGYLLRCGSTGGYDKDANTVAESVRGGGVGPKDGKESSVVSKPGTTMKIMYERYLLSA